MKEVIMLSFDYSKLRGKIREIFGTEERFAKEMALSTVSLSFKLNGKREWTQQEINRACELLTLEREDIPEYFFKLKIKIS
jgi:hypothetical protein